jgi:hypothetical protein
MKKVINIKNIDIKFIETDYYTLYVNYKYYYSNNLKSYFVSDNYDVSCEFDVMEFKKYFMNERKLKIIKLSK